LSPPNLNPNTLVIPDKGDFVYEFEVEVRPSFDLPEYKKLKLKRYAKGEAVSEDPQFFPVDPDSQAMVCPVDTMILLRKEVVALETLLAGDLSDPTNEKPGLGDIGKKLIDELKSIGH
jgi:trigger factor